MFPLTKERPKALLPILGKPLLERLALQLRHLGVSEMVVVGGYKQERILAAVKRIQRLTGMKIHVVTNDRYQMTNTLFSLMLAARHCTGRPVMIIDGDVVCEDEVLARVLHGNQDAVLAVDTCRVMGEEEVKVRFGKGDQVLAIGKGVSRGSAEFLGISKFSPRFARSLFQVARRILREGRQSEFYESAFAVLRSSGRTLHALDVAGLKWMEIDFLTDYEEALRLFGSSRELREFRESRRMKPQCLFAPGPVLVPPRVKEALVRSEIGHRETEFSELLNRVRMKLARLYGVRNFHEYATVVITGSGSAANEAVLGTAGVGKNLLILANGEFGERWIDLAEFLELKFESLKLRWGQPFPLNTIENLIRRKGVDAVCMVHHETSTGMLNPLQQIAALTKRYRKELFVDAVSSIGALPVDVEENEITFCTGSANKAIASVPGLSFVCGKRSAFDGLKLGRSRSMYLDLYKHFVYNDQQYQTPNTPAVNLFFALEAALDEILDRGIPQTFENYRNLAAQLRAGLKDLGFRFFISEEHMSPVLTTVDLPPGFGAEEFHDRLKQLGYITYAGKGILKDRVFQVANIGALGPKQAKSFLRALARVIQ